MKKNETFLARFSTTMIFTGMADVMSRFDHHTLIDEVSINNNSNPTFKKKRGGRCAIFTGFFLAMHMFIDTPFTHLSQVVDHSKVQNPSIQAEESANNFLKSS